jgi:hypothetical protein
MGVSGLCFGEGFFCRRCDVWLLRTSASAVNGESENSPRLPGLNGKASFSDGLVLLFLLDFRRALEEEARALEAASEAWDEELNEGYY